MSIRLIIALLFAVVVSLFAIQNADVVSVSFMAAKLQISQALVILLSAIIGAIMAMLFGVVRWIKTTQKTSAQHKTIVRLEKENTELTSMVAKLQDEVATLSATTVQNSHQSQLDQQQEM